MKTLSKKIFTKFLIENPYLTQEDQSHDSFSASLRHFKKYEVISDEVIESLSDLKGEASFGIVQLNENLAKEMAKIQGAYIGLMKSGQPLWGHSLELPNLKSISAECLNELIKFGGTLKLNNLEKLSDEEISILSKHCSSKSRSTKSRIEVEPVGIELCKLRYISEMGAKSLAKYKGERLKLMSLKNIPEKAAIALKSYKGKLDLWFYGMRDPWMVYKHLENHCHGVTPETCKLRREVISCSICGCEVYPSDIPSGRKDLIARTLNGGGLDSGKLWDKCDPCLLKELEAEEN
jgi:hypothetical protein